MGIEAIPKVKVTAVQQEYGTWILYVHDCPFCHGSHSHSGGFDRRPNLGCRVAPCPGVRVKSKEYELVLKMPVADPRDEIPFEPETGDRIGGPVGDRVLPGANEGVVFKTKGFSLRTYARFVKRAFASRL